MTKALVSIITVLVLVVLGLLGVVLGWWSSLTGGDTGPSPSLSPEPTFVERSVTTGPHVPTARALTPVALQSVTADWVLAIYNSDSFDDAGNLTPGTKVLYLISPEGDRSEVVNLTDAGFEDPDLVAWNYATGDVLVSDGSDAGPRLAVIPLKTGEIASEWVYCGGSAFVTGQSVSEGWLLRGSCDESGIDGVYDSQGNLVASEIVRGDFGAVVRDVGDVQVVTGFEVLPEERFEATYPDGSSRFLPPPAGLDCYPLEKGLGDTLAITCSAAGDSMPSVWELSVRGDQAREVVSVAQTTALRDALGYAPDDFLGIFGYCADSSFRALEFEGYEGRLGVTFGSELRATDTPPFIHQECHAAKGTRSLVSGNGPLWWIDWDTGETVTLLPGSDEFPLFVVGAAHTTALAHPGE